MAHRDLHPEPVDGCFGCKALSVGFDGGTLTRAATDENNATLTEHRDGRVDVTVRPKPTAVGLTVRSA